MVVKKNSPSNRKQELVREYKIDFEGISAFHKTNMMKVVQPASTLAKEFMDDKMSGL
jgi:hypothetical protein